MAVVIVGDAVIAAAKMTPPRLLEDGAQRPFRRVAWMVGNSGVMISCGVEPNLVTACRLPVELKSEQLQTSIDVSIPETCKTTHQVATMSG